MKFLYREMRIWNKITIWDILHKQSECTVTKQMYGSKFKKISRKNFKLKILEFFFITRARDRLGVEMSKKPTRNNLFRGSNLILYPRVRL